MRKDKSGARLLPRLAGDWPVSVLAVAVAEWLFAPSAEVQIALFSIVSGARFKRALVKICPPQFVWPAGWCMEPTALIEIDVSLNLVKKLVLPPQ